MDVPGEEAGVPSGWLRNPAQIHHWPVHRGGVAAFTVQSPVVGQLFVSNVHAQFALCETVGAGANHIVGITIQTLGIPELLAHHQTAAAGGDVEKEVRVRAFELDSQFVVADDFRGIQVNTAPVIGVGQQSVFASEHTGAVKNVAGGKLPPVVVELNSLSQIESPASAIFGQFPICRQLRNPDVLLGVNIDQHFHYQVHLLVVVNRAAPGEVGLAGRWVNSDDQGIDFDVALLLGDGCSSRSGGRS